MPWVPKAILQRLLNPPMLHTPEGFDLDQAAPMSSGVRASTPKGPPPIKPYVDEYDRRMSLSGFLAMRMGWLGASVEGQLLPVNFIEAVEVKPGHIAVFVVNNGQHVTLEDTSGMFPCDDLIMKLRVLLGKS